MSKRDVRQKRMKVFMSLFIIVIMTASVLGVYVYNQDDTGVSDFYGYDVIRINNQFVIKTDNYDILLDLPPANTDFVNISDGARVLLQNSDSMILSFDETDFSTNIDHVRMQLITQSFNRNLVFSNGISKSSDVYSFPVVDCDSAEGTVLYLKYGDDTKISNSGSCITASFKTSNDLYLVKDKLLVEIFGLVE